MFAAMNMRDRLRFAPPDRGIFWSFSSINITSLRDEEAASAKPCQEPKKLIVCITKSGAGRTEFQGPDFFRFYPSSELLGRQSSAARTGERPVSK